MEKLADERAEHDFFVSYTARDEKWAEWIAWTLEEVGYSVVIQKWDFLPGSDFVGEMEDATRRAKRLIVVLSAAYLESDPAGREWHAAFVADMSGRDRKIIPVRIEAFDAVSLLSSLQYINLVGLDEEAARRKLVTELNFYDRRKPLVPPPFPGGEGAVPAYPGSTVLTNLPVAQNTFFAGRERETRAVIDAIETPRERTLVVALTGLGGIGKSRLAREVAFRVLGHLRLIWTMRAATPSEFSAGLEELSSVFGLTVSEDAGGDFSPLRSQLGEALGRFEPWLLIIDECFDVNIVREWLPGNGDGRVLVTTRDSTISADLHLELEPLTYAGATQLIQERAAASELEAERLAALLDGLPLALEQAVGYIDASGMSVDEYCGLYRTRHSDLLARGIPSDYPLSVATTWSLSLERLESGSPASVALLNLLACLDSVPVPRWLLGSIVASDGEAVSELGDPIAQADAIIQLRRHSLVFADLESLTMHALVKLVSLDRLGSDRRCQFVRAAVLIFDRVSGARDTSDIASIVPHVVNLGDPRSGCDEPADALSRILTEAAGMIVPFSPDDAALVANRAVVLAAQAGDERGELGGRAHLVLAKAASLRGEGPLAAHEAGLALNALSATTSSGEYRDALILHAGAIAKLDQSEARKSRRLLLDEVARVRAQAPTDLEGLAALLKTLGNLEHVPLRDVASARKHLVEAYEIRRELFGVAHLLTVNAASDLGYLLLDIGRRDEARAVLTSALVDVEREIGGEHVQLAPLLINLALVQYRDGDLVKAQELLERAVSIRRKFLGPTAPRTLNAENSLLGVLIDRGERSRAEALIAEIRDHYDGAGLAEPTEVSVRAAQLRSL